MIPAFPQFVELHIHHKDEMSSFTTNFEPYSDFSFVNLFAWNTDGQAEVSWLNRNLVIKLPDYMEKGKHIYSIFGINEIDKSLAALLEFTPRLELVPHLVINNLKNPENFKIVEDRDNFDYVYKVDDLALLPGNAYKKKRNRINQTVGQLGERIDTKTVTKMTKDLRLDMLEVLKKWQTQTVQPKRKVELEGIAINRLFDHFYFFDLQITTCRVDGKLMGFSINEILDEAFGICHFEKTLTTEHDGIGAILINEAARALMDKTTIINWEQDLGIPGLKQSKTSYCPIKFQRKYWISKDS